MTIMYWMIGLNPAGDRFVLAVVIAILVVQVVTSYGKFKIYSALNIHLFRDDQTGYLISTLASDLQVALGLAPPLMIPLLIFGGFFLRSKWGLNFGLWSTKFTLCFTCQHCSCLSVLDRVHFVVQVQQWGLCDQPMERIWRNRVQPVQPKLSCGPARLYHVSFNASCLLYCGVQARYEFFRCPPTLDCCSNGILDLPDNLTTTVNIPIPCQFENGSDVISQSGLDQVRMCWKKN